MTPETNSGGTAMPTATQPHRVESATKVLTTAESLIVELVAAHHALGLPATTLSNRLWVRPQLEALQVLGVVSWVFDENADFRIKAEPVLFELCRSV